MSGSPRPRPPVPRFRAFLAALLLAPLIVSVALWAFAWPAARTAPRELPVGIAGPPAAAAPVEQQLTRHAGEFDVHRYGDETAAREAVERREIYGAFVVRPDGPHVLTASAASPVVAQALQQAAGGGHSGGEHSGGGAANPPSANGGTAHSTDVVAAPSADPRGAALSSSVLPMAIGGVVAGAVVVTLGLRGTRAVLALLGAAALVGGAAAALTHSWLGVLTGDWWAEAAAFGLMSLAVSAGVAGLGTLVGPAGIGLGAMVMVMFGNPLSGVTSAPEMLPQPLGDIGQWLPPGAGATLLRSVGFFDGRASDSPVLVLTVWAVAGLTLVTIGGLRKQPGPEPESGGRPQPAARVPAG
ncbi:ABC transporter permease [Streptomyces sp. HNM0575]|uniref:ABC transporter permease n=1 Tax=Streptomyces sp. HNM0575 TaxID=2716338 RepID=UPI00145D7AD9|nr:ABC transporter permease [Streptomyces sp. HNM0575]NLU73436.1 ABC transporter permease [Streptomyces sp. HNM0575]